MSRAGVVRYGPWTTNPRKVSFCGRKEHDQRRGLAPDQPPGVNLRAQREGDLDSLIGPAECRKLPFPDEPLLVASAERTPAGQRNAPAGVRPGGRRPFQHDLLDQSAAADPLDAAQKQQGLDTDGAKGCGDLLDGDSRGDFGAVEGEYENGPRFGWRLGPAVHRIGPDVLLDHGILGPAADPRAVGIRVNRLEPDAELADLGQVIRFAALADPADAADVSDREVAPVVPHLEAIGEEREGQVGRTGVLGVLDQLEDEVRALAVELPEQFEYGRVPAVAGDIFRPDLVIISGH